MSTLTAAIDLTLQTRRDSVVIVWEARETRFMDLDRDSAAQAAGLIAQGVRPGDRVVVGLPNSPDLVACVVAVLRAGAVLVPLSPASPAADAAWVVRDCTPRLVVTHPEQAEALRRERVGVPVYTDIPAQAGQGPFPVRDAEDPALIIYTSGTTGHPKGAVLSHRALLSNLSTVATAWGWTAADRLLLTLPCFHLHGLGLGILTSLLVGSSIVLRPRFVAEDVPGLLRDNDCTMFFGVPTMYNRLVQLPAEAVAGLSGMRLWVSGSAPLPAPTWERFRERFGFALMDRYGMTEAGFVISTPLDEPRRPGVVGRPLPGIDVRLVDPEALNAGRVEPTPGAEIGEMIFRGPNLFSGYWHRPPETRAAFVDDFLRSGDLAAREADGMFRIAGRRSVDIIKSAGFKIGAVEIESRLQEHPDVTETAVVGIPDPDRGERVVAAVTPIPGRAPSADDLRAFLRARLPPHKVPAEIVFVDEIPRTGPGKFRKTELRALLQRRLDGGD